MKEELASVAPNIVLIGGSGRSGTNITKQILGAHSQIYALPFEHRLTIDPDGLVDFYTRFSESWSPYSVDIKLKRLKQLIELLGGESLVDKILGGLILRLNPQRRIFSPRRYHGWQLRKAFPSYLMRSKELLAELIDFSYQATWVGTESYRSQPEMLFSSHRQSEDVAKIIGRFINGLVDDCLKERGKKVFVEDNTWNILFARQLLDFTPQAKVVHVYREPKDVVASLVSQSWAPDDLVASAIWYRDIMLKWFETKKEIPKDSLFEFSLEMLVNEPAGIVSRLCEFVGVTFESSLVDIDLSSAHKDRWKKDIPRELLTNIDEILGDVYKELDLT